MPEEAFRDMGDGIYIQSRQNADLFTVAHFREKTKPTNILLRELLFADDNALIGLSAKEIQRIVNAFANASSKFGLKINIKKTEVMFQPNSTMTMEEDMNVDETTRHSLQAVELSQRTQAAVQIVSNLPAPSNGCPIYRFLGMPAMRTSWMAGAVTHKSG